MSKGKSKANGAQKPCEVYLVVADNWVAEMSGAVVGLLGMLKAEIGGLFVGPEAQGRGVSRALVEHAAALHGEVTLEVYEDNTRARHFYDLMGCVERGRRADEDTGHTLILMLRPTVRAPALRASRNRVMSAH
ncbi:GNAT family N-acetyltransferase [Nonomuraea ceibae]|uniref:GNAT family N-acetyltransferase n=1 Tax=Nonomuraea ceibae TaxID=1935170 RepID=UPI001C5E2DA8|nr:GNAT family N-acetyltransferase [Nonomuraea ceibae]